MTKEKIVRAIVNFVFILRYWVLVALLGAVTYLSYYVYKYTNGTIKDAVSVFSSGAIVVTLFYAFITYEYNQRKFRHDVKTGKDAASFNIALEWQREYMNKTLNTLRFFHNEHKALLEDGMLSKFQDELEKPENNDAYNALLVILNFLESVSLGVKQGMMDEKFIEGFFGSIFALYYHRYSPYILYRRRNGQGSVKNWIEFTNLSEKWLSC